MHSQENSLFDLGSRSHKILPSGVKVTQNVAHNPLHHVTYSGIKFEFVTSSRLVADAFTRKYIYLTLTLRYEMLPLCPLHHVTYSGTKVLHLTVQVKMHLQEN